MVRVIGGVYAKTRLRLSKSSNLRRRCAEELRKELGSSFLIAICALVVEEQWLLEIAE
jgi:hypothetical protein